MAAEQPGPQVSHLHPNPCACEPFPQVSHCKLAVTGPLASKCEVKNLPLLPGVTELCLGGGGLVTTLEV